MTLRQHRRNRPPGAPPDLFGSQSKSSYPLRVGFARPAPRCGRRQRQSRAEAARFGGSRCEFTAVQPSQLHHDGEVESAAAAGLGPDARRAAEHGGPLIRFSAGAVVVHRDPQPWPVSSRIDSHDAARAAAGIGEQVAQHRLQGRLLQRLLAGLVVACSGILPLRESATGSPTGGTRRPTFPRAAVPRATGFRLRPCRAQGARRPVPPHAE